MNPFERVIDALDVKLKTLSGSYVSANRPDPGAGKRDELSESERKHVAALMRVNHTGEVCAQALYAGQSLFARNEHTRAQMAESAAEEVDHLVWTRERIKELGGKTSVLDPIFYTASFALGATAALVSDKASLGFVHATEENVEAHLDEHLNQLPPTAEKTRAVLEVMREDERHHGQSALDEGGQELPKPVRGAMKAVAKVMTTTAYRI